MTFEIELEVTAEDICAGKPGEACNCPVALALKRALPNWQDVQVDGAVSVRVLDEEFEWHSSEVNTFVERFDEGLPVWPFKTRAVFELVDGGGFDD